jgi:UDP-GlcNAc:undecaprenyl-phosphate GlcNAc-1-phosphate transferase
MRRPEKGETEGENMTLTVVSFATVAVTAAVGVAILVQLMRPIALRIGLVDVPVGRKTHTGNIPLIGGPAIWLVIVIGNALVFPSLYASALLATSTLILMGIMDDRQPIRAPVKLLAQLSICLAFVLAHDIRLHDIGVYPWFGAPEYGVYHTALATLALVGAINCFNFIDGIDGLCASLALATFIHVALAFQLNGEAPPTSLVFQMALYLGALLTFLGFNLGVFGHRKIFLGDSGSIFLGFSVGTLTLVASQTNAATAQSVIPASLCLWIVALPVADLVFTSLRRMATNRSPMAPDRSHLHYVLIDGGWSPRASLVWMIIGASAAFWLGFFILHNFGEPATVAGFLCFLVFYAGLAETLRRRMVSAH